MHKLIDGVQVEMSPEEEAAVLAEWKASEEAAVKLEEIEKAIKYLNSTDYLVIRASMEGYSLDPAVLVAREEARKTIREGK